MMWKTRSEATLGLRGRARPPSLLLVAVAVALCSSCTSAPDTGAVATVVPIHELSPVLATAESTAPAVNDLPPWVSRAYEHPKLPLMLVDLPPVDHSVPRLEPTDPPRRTGSWMSRGYEVVLRAVHQTCRNTSDWFWSTVVQRIAAVQLRAERTMSAPAMATQEPSPLRDRRRVPWEKGRIMRMIAMWFVGVVHVVPLACAWLTGRSEGAARDPPVE